MAYPHFETPSTVNKILNFNLNIKLLIEAEYLKQVTSAAVVPVDKVRTTILHTTSTWDIPRVY